VDALWRCVVGGGGSSAHEAKKKTARRASGIENFIMKNLF
jgi:hypothetical protein